MTIEHVVRIPMRNQQVVAFARFYGVTVHTCEVRDPASNIPAIEDHIQSLRADRELASAMDVNDFVIRNLTDQITSYQTVLDSMRIKLATFDQAQRNEIEQAVATLRKVRAGAGRIQLPITAVAPQPAS